MNIDICWKYENISSITGVYKYKKVTWLRNEWRA